MQQVIAKSKYSKWESKIGKKSGLIWNIESTWIEGKRERWVLGLIDRR